MTQDEIIEMARHAGFEGCAELTWENVICTEELVAFAKLVAEHEREACAKVADHMASRCNDIRAAALESAAENIRARGQA
jgi:hypothetical protein